MLSSHDRRNNRVQPLQRVAGIRSSPVPAKIELIKTLIKDESTIGYEGQRNETKAAPVTH